MSMITELIERLRESADDTELDMECSRACDGECNKLLIEAADVIEELSTKLQAANMERSSQYYNGGWIPVSERLPEVNQRVLVTSYGRVCYAMMTSADGNSGHPVFRLQDSLNKRVVCETTVHSEFTTSRIIAWMPLPEPYKTESEDKE